MASIRDEYRALDSLRPHPRNYNRHQNPDTLAKMAAKVRCNAFTAPFIVTEDGTILGGHLRRLTLLKLRADNYPEPEGVQPGWLVPCRVFGGNEAQELALLAGDNPDPAEIDYDTEALTALLADLQAQGALEGSGYDDARLEALIGELAELGGAGAGEGDSGLLDGVDPDAVPENAPTRCQPGDLWQLGNHRLLCGDSTNPEDVARLMGGERAGMVFTDPPYGVRFQSGMAEGGTASRFEPLQNDEVILNVAPVALGLLRDDAAAFIWTCHQTYPEWRGQFVNAYRHTLIWYKPGGGIGDLYGNYATDYELCLFCVKGRPLFRGKRGMAVWQVAKDSVNEYQHPTQKPVELAERAMLDFSDAGDLIWDGFLGSGSTLIAAEKSGRRCYGMELDCTFADVILARWEQATGHTAELLERVEPN